MTAKMIKTTEKSAIESAGIDQESKPIAQGFTMEDLKRKKDRILSSRVTHTTIGVGIPNAQVVFQIIDDPAFRLAVLLFKFKLAKQESICIVIEDSPSAEYLYGKLMNATLHVGICRSGHMFIYPVIEADPVTGDRHQWHAARDEVVRLGKLGPISVSADKQGGVGYLVTAPEGAEMIVMPTIPPHINMMYLINAAFAGKILKELDHPIIKALQAGMPI
jgi:hypothetical protein